MATAKELKAANAKPARVRKNTSTVKVSYLPETRRVKRAKKLFEDTPRDPRTSSELSLQARFVDLRPKDVHPWDWHQLYIEDESLWPMIADEAIDAVESGELQRYDRLR